MRSPENAEDEDHVFHSNSFCMFPQNPLRTISIGALHTLKCSQEKILKYKDNKNQCC